MSHCSKQLTDLTILNQWRLHWINFNKRGDLKEFGPTYKFLWNKLAVFILGQNIQLEVDHLTVLFNKFFVLASK